MAAGKTSSFHVTDSSRVHASLLSRAERKRVLLRAVKEVTGNLPVT